jgi:branched-chain amino acid transport system ATP-binding protein
VLLEVENLSVRFGGVHAVQDVSFAVLGNEAVGIAGPNGAGKSSVINAVTALVRASSGSIRIGGEDGGPVDVTRRSAEARSRLGLARTFQHGALLEELTVLDNVLCGARSEAEGGWVSAVLCTPAYGRRWRAAEEAAVATLGDVGLPDLPLRRRVRDLAPADRQLVSLARALIAQPRVLFLDEVSAGTDPATKSRIGQLVRDFCARPGCGVVFVEHDLTYLRQVADRLIFMAEGQILAVGAPNEVLGRPDVLRAYIGGEPEVIGA